VRREKLRRCHVTVFLAVKEYSYIRYILHLLIISSSDAAFGYSIPDGNTQSVTEVLGRNAVGGAISLNIVSCPDL
jgi:hypothetical protein